MLFKKLHSFCVTVMVVFSTFAIAQEPAPPASVYTPANKPVDVEIMEGVRKLEFRKLNDSTQLTILAGNVKLKQGTAFFYCDSCVINNQTNTFEAWGNVHINDADTAHAFSGHLRYLIQKRIAYLDKGVKLTDGKGTLTTPELEYDLNTKIGTYMHGGKVVNKKTTLTSKEGYYYADLYDVYFKKNVVLVDPAYTILTDSLLYNTQTQVTRFIAKTIIKDSAGRTIETKEGYYNLATGKAEFGQRPVVTDGPRKYIANRIISDDSTGIIQLSGNAVITDSSGGTTVIAGLIVQDRKNERTLATNKPLLILRQNDDTIYISADTLYTARLTDLINKTYSPAIDTLNQPRIIGKYQNDCTNRYLEAYHNVKIFSDSLQAVSDSLFYSFRDSVFRLFKDPIVWARESQVSGDTLFLFTKNKKAEKLLAYPNSFLINRLDTEIYNQVKSNRLYGWFTDGNLDSVRSAGEATCIYYIQDEDSSYIGINESKAEILDYHFRNQELYKVVFRTQVRGTIWPIGQKKPSEMRLPGFRWLESRRPKSKLDLY